MKKIITFLLISLISISAFCKNISIKVTGEDYNKIRIHNYSSFEKISGIVKKMEKSNNGFGAPSILDRFTVEGIDGETDIKGKIKEDGYLVIVLDKEYDGKIKASLSYKNYPGYDIVIINFEDK
ncbi:hypothetical protein [Treponema sp. UBA3813]|uniref:hypothetical protein n=1 Tax=Treponema sp. UBA3813 TaxID=1947715 RepID=UPI0025E721F0|nr:hypothetical protein [Treponema sp. UBA3813]